MAESASKSWTVPVPQAGVLCLVSELSESLDDEAIEMEKNNPNSTIFNCCSGFCVDLLQKFSNDLKFDFALKRVKDGLWGGSVKVRRCLLYTSPSPRD